MSRILVTGAGGYLGARVLERLKTRGVEAFGTARNRDSDFECDLLEPEQVDALMARAKATCVIHCAASVPKSDGGYADRDAAAASVAMVDHLCRSRPGRVVFVSSMTVYGTAPPRPVAEDRTAPASAYAEGKLAAERRLLDDRHVSATVLRLPGLFGPPRRGGLVYALCEAMASGRLPRLPEAPVTWAAMHVEDAASAIVRAALRPPDGDLIMNVGYPEPMSISQLVRDVAAVTGTAVAYDVGHPTFEFDLNHMRRYIGLPQVSMHSRLVEMLDELRQVRSKSPKFHTAFSEQELSRCE